MLRTRGTRTDEAARCALLLPALAALAAASPGPLALVEIGASAGLCLLYDSWRYRYTTDAGVHEVGDRRSPVTLTCAVSGPAPLPQAVLSIAWRAGLDLHPLDPADPDQRRWLRCLVWPERAQRAERLGAALDLAAHVRAEVRAGDMTRDPTTWWLLVLDRRCTAGPPRGGGGAALGSIRCHSAQMPPPLAITATAALRSAADVEQAARQVREALGSSAVVEQDDGAVLVARCGSRTAYRLLGAWTKGSQVPMRVRFDLAARDGGTQITVSMTSDQGRGYLTMTSLAHQHYRARFDQLVADLERTGLTTTGPVHEQ